MSLQPTPLSAALKTEVINACRAAFYYRDDLKSLMLGAGVSAAVYNRYDHREIAKVKIARSIIDELHNLGPDGWRIQRKIVAELCGMTRPANGVEDVKSGKAALAELRRIASQDGIIIDTERAAINDRKTRDAKRIKQIDERREHMGKLSTRFAELAQARPRTQSERQARGYELEKLIADLSRLEGLDYIGSSRPPHEQIDGSFYLRGFTYLVEARWRDHAPTTNELAGFKVKVDGKLESTRGLFISMAGFDEDVLNHFANNSGARNIIYMTGQDLALIFGGQVGLIDALMKKIEAAENRGEYLVDLV